MKKISLLICIIMLILCAKGVCAQEMAPDFTLTDIEGVAFTFSDYRGKVALLDFFATWCGPCVAQIPLLKSLNEEFGEDLVIISISVSPDFDSVGKLQEFKQEHEIDWIIVRDTIGINYEYGVQYIPTLVIVDQDGYIQHKHVGLTSESVLHTEIDEIIPEFGKWISIIFLLLTFTVIVAIYKMKPKNQINKNILTQNNSAASVSGKKEWKKNHTASEFEWIRPPRNLVYAYS